jgi:hypothetical protein
MARTGPTFLESRTKTVDGVGATSTQSPLPALKVLLRQRRGSGVVIMIPIQLGCGRGDKASRLSLGQGGFGEGAQDLSISGGFDRLLEKRLEVSLSK